MPPALTVHNPAGAGRAATRLAPSSAWAERETLRLCGALLAAALLLQRFGVPFGAKPISLVGPVGFLIAAVGLWRGVLAIDRRRLMIFFGLLGWVAIGVIWQSTHPDNLDIPTNLTSVAQFLALTSFVVLSFVYATDETRFFERVNWWFAFIACAGIVQFAAQFVGIRIFEFTGLLPSQILYEEWYNLVIPVGVAGLFKSNGFFLIEPSVFSQFMAMALIIEILVRKRVAFLLLFAAGLMLSFSGTGWIVLVSFVLGAAAALGLRGILIAVLTIAVLAVAIAAVVLLAPHLAAAFSDRFSEFSEIGTSGHDRFVTPFWLMSDILKRSPAAAIFGIGGGGSEAVSMPYSYNVNTPIKIFLEYGLPALIAYLALFLVNTRTPTQRALVLPGLVLLLFTGGYQQFPPVLFPIILLLCTARLRPSTA